MVDLWEVAHKRKLVTIATLNNNEWIVTTPDGYFDASKRGIHYLTGRVAEILLPGSVVGLRYNVPGLLGRLMARDTSYRLDSLRRLLERSGSVQGSRERKRHD